MRSREFYKLSAELMSPVLKPQGFNNDGSKRSVFHRQVSDNIFHCIIPWLKGRGGATFEIRVLATSPLIDIEFAERFPDELGMPLDRMTDLDPTKGVTFISDHTFRGNKKEGFIRNFNNQAKPAIIEHAIPYLDKIDTLEKLLSNMKPTSLPVAKLSYALAHWHTGQIEKAKKLLLEHREYLLNRISEHKKLEPVNKADSNLHQSSIDYLTFAIEHIESLLGVSRT